MNRNSLKLLFDDEIKFDLERHLENTIWNNVNRISERADELIELHSKFIRNVKNKMNANEKLEKNEYFNLIYNIKKIKIYNLD